MRLYADVFANACPVFAPPCGRALAGNLAENAREMMNRFETH
jgi:hypothetical protein